MPKRTALTLSACLLLLSAQQLRTYNDPGSAALLLQIMAGAAVGCLFYLRKILGWLGGKWKATQK